MALERTSAERILKKALEELWGHTKKKKKESSQLQVCGRNEKNGVGLPLKNV